VLCFDYSNHTILKDKVNIFIDKQKHKWYYQYEMKRDGFKKPKLSDQVAGFKNLCLIHRGEYIEKSPPRKARAKETKPRNQPERRLRRDVIKTLRKRGYRVSRVENSISGKDNTGLGDLWVFNEWGRFAGWVELKSESGRLTGEQPEFQRLCQLCGVNYWVIKSESDLDMIKPAASLWRDKGGELNDRP
jgi:hypothetical protein